MALNDGVDLLVVFAIWFSAWSLLDLLFLQYVPSRLVKGLIYLLIFLAALMVFLLVL
jgi:hypothetical protein